MARIQDVPQPDDPRRVERTQQRRTQELREAAKTGTPGADRVDVSTDTRDIESLKTALMNESKNVPDVREDRVAAVKQKLESGELDTPEARGKIADSLLDQFGI